MAMTACSDGGGAAGANESGEAKTIQIATYSAPGSPLNTALRDTFIPALEEATDGSLTAELYDNSQLGGEEEYFRATRSGAVQMAVNGSIMSNEVPEVGVVGLPFLFEDFEHARETLTGEIGTELTGDFESKLGLRFLGFSANGFRDFTANKPLENIDDFNGLKLRISSGYPERLEMARALKTNPTPLDFSELYSSLDEGVVQAQENPVQLIVSQNFHEVQSHYLDSNHIFAVDFVTMNADFWDALTDEQQKAVQDAMDRAMDESWTLTQESEESAMETLRENGMKVIEPDEAFTDAMREAMEPVYESYYAKNAWAEAMVDKIRGR